MKSLIDLHIILPFFKILQTHLTIDMMDTFYGSEYQHKKCYLINETTELNLKSKV